MQKRAPMGVFSVAAVDDCGERLLGKRQGTLDQLGRLARRHRVEAEKQKYYCSEQRTPNPPAFVSAWGGGREWRSNAFAVVSAAEARKNRSETKWARYVWELQCDVFARNL